jgi:hypothetical protein
MVMVVEDPLLLERRSEELERYLELIELGFSPDTSALVADAPVSLESITQLLLPDAAR